MRTTIFCPPTTLKMGWHDNVGFWNRFELLNVQEAVKQNTSIRCLSVDAASLTAYKADRVASIIRNFERVSKFHIGYYGALEERDDDPEV